MLLSQHNISLGDMNLSQSRVGIGTWAIGGGWGPQPEEQSLDAILFAIEQGCALIDTAALYGNGRAERLVACALQSCDAHVVTLTKIYPLHYHWAPAPGTSIESVYPREHIVEQVEGSLRRLATDCLDAVLFQTWCPSWAQERAWHETMLTLQRQGKIRAFGISVSDHRSDEANEVIKAGLVNIIEAPYSILDQRAAFLLFPIAQRYHTSIIVRTPLASGALTGTWHEGMKFHRRDWRRRVFRDDLLQQTLQRVALVQSLVGASIPLAQIALRFCLSHPAVTAIIPGVRSAEQVACNFMVLDQEPLPQTLLDQMALLWDETFQYHVRTSIGEEGEG